MLFLAKLTAATSSTPLVRMALTVFTATSCLRFANTPAIATAQVEVALIMPDDSARAVLTFSVGIRLDCDSKVRIVQIAVSKKPKMATASGFSILSWLLACLVTHNSQKVFYYV